MPNAANTAAVVAGLAEAAPAGITVTDRHPRLRRAGRPGHRTSDEVLRAAGFPTGHGYMSFVEVDGDGHPVTVCRTGYTGERGYELVVPSDRADAVWDALAAAGAPYGLQPAGLGARDTLRTEMGYPLHGQDISPTITPVQARLGWAVGWKKDAFFGDTHCGPSGRPAPPGSCAGSEAVGRGIPRPGMVVRAGDGEEIGAVTSGHLLADPEDRHRPGPGRRHGSARTTSSASTSAPAASSSSSKPPFVTPGVREP